MSNERPPPFRAGETLARILARTRPPAEQLDASEWSAFASRRYATVIELRAPPAEIRWAPPTVGANGRTANRLEEAWVRRTAFIRKRLALALFVLADERTQLEGDDSPWYALAARWAATYERLPGGEIPVDAGFALELDELRAYERAAASLRHEL